MHHAGDRVLPTRGSKAVHHEVYLTEVFLDSGNCLLLDLITEGIAVDALGVQALGLGKLVKGRRVVPAGSTGLALAAFFLKKDAQGRRTSAKCST